MSMSRGKAEARTFYSFPDCHPWEPGPEAWMDWLRPPRPGEPWRHAFASGYIEIREVSVGVSPRQLWRQGHER